MEKQFCTYKVSAELKEVGFDEECIALYTTDNYGGSVTKPALISVGGKWGSSVSCQTINYSDCRLEHNELTAPLWQQAIDWLESKGYYINITRVYQWNPLPITFLGWCIYIGTNDPEERLECNNYYVDHYYSSKEEAREEAILKTLELCKNNL